MPGFRDFLVLVLNDSALRDELLGERDLPALVARTLELAGQRGITVTGEELQAVIQANRRSWLERWTDR